jgi:uncharacterized protein HemX
MPVFSSAIAAALAAGTLAAGAGVYQGLSAQQSQKKALTAQQREQERALNQATLERTRSAQRASEEAKKQPDMAAIAASAAKPKASQTMLTGPGGVSSGQLTLGRNTLLGQ